MENKAGTISLQKYLRKKEGKANLRKLPEPLSLLAKTILLTLPPIAKPHFVQLLYLL
jgi:hypothetical protein